MSLVKNSPGVSIVMHSSKSNYDKMGSLAGSSLDRIKVKKEELTPFDNNSDNDIPEYLVNQKLLLANQKATEAKQKAIEAKQKPKKLRKMSQRTRSKIRKKVIAFSRVEKKLSFVTLTFCNEVKDNIAVKILGKFVNNVKKLSKDFQYLWVAEKQTKNNVFVNNIHFHLITNKFWDIKKWLKYWFELQADYGIVPRDRYASSAFDVKHINSRNIKSVSCYLTKYVTKNANEFGCQVWNCSKKVSRLYTDFYSGQSFIRTLEKLQDENLLGGEIKTYKQDYCDVKHIPLNNAIMPFYYKIDKENLINWKSQ